MHLQAEVTYSGSYPSSPSISAVDGKCTFWPATTVCWRCRRLTTLFVALVVTGNEIGGLFERKICSSKIYGPEVRGERRKGNFLSVDSRIEIPVAAAVRVNIPDTTCVVNESVDISSTRYSFTGIVAVTVAVGAGVKTTVVTTDGTTLMSARNKRRTTLFGCSVRLAF